ncbi:MAG: hypothetical protein EOP49_51930, partial [Sphingobacteriales bacterium]
MKKIAITGIVLLMSLSLFGIIGLQVYWINNALHVKEAELDRAVNDALVAVAAKLEARETAKIVEESMRLVSGGHPTQEPAPQTNRKTLPVAARNRAATAKKDKQASKYAAPKAKQPDVFAGTGLRNDSAYVYSFNYSGVPRFRAGTFEVVNNSRAVSEINEQIQIADLQPGDQLRKVILRDIPQKEKALAEMLCYTNTRQADEALKVTFDTLVIRKPEKFTGRLPVRNPEIPRQALPAEEANGFRVLVKEASQVPVMLRDSAVVLLAAGSGRKNEIRTIPPARPADNRPVVFSLTQNESAPSQQQN